MNSDGTSKKFLLIRILICILLCIVTVLFVGQINALNILSQNYMLILIAAAAILCGLVSVLVYLRQKDRNPDRLFCFGGGFSSGMWIWFFLCSQDWNMLEP